jgi:hypothetical protein
MMITLLRDNCWTQLRGAVFEVKKRESDRERERERERGEKPCHSKGGIDRWLW